MTFIINKIKNDFYYIVFRYKPNNMGIKSLNEFLRDVCPEVFQPVHLSQLQYKKVAIDISLYMHKYKAACGDRWQSAFINLVSSLRRNEVHCIFIFDGKAPPEKNIEHEKRRESKQKFQDNIYELEEGLNEYHRTGYIPKCLVDMYKRRRSPSHKRLLGSSTDDKVDIKWVEQKIEQRKNQLYSVSSDDFDLAKTLFRMLNVPFLEAPFEAEKMCSKLCIDGIVDAVLSEDTDIIAYGSPAFITKIDTSNDTVVFISYETILEGTKLTSEQLLDLCIMCGTDYNSNIPKIGSKTAYKYITNCENIEGIESKMGLDVSILNYKRVRQLFTEFDGYDMVTVPYCGTPDFDLLEKFVHEHKMNINLTRVRKDFTYTEVVFEDSDSEDIVDDTGDE